VSLRDEESRLPDDIRDEESRLPDDIRDEESGLPDLGCGLLLGCGEKVDVRGIPPGILVLDPKSEDRTESFRGRPLPEPNDAEGEDGEAPDEGEATN